MRFDWQNLNDRKGGGKGSGLRHGRAWLVVGRIRFRWSWNFWTHFCGAEITTGREETDLTFFLAFPPVAFWFSVGGLFPRANPYRDARFVRREKEIGWRAYSEWRRTHPGERQTGIRIFDWGVWFDFWTPAHESSSRDPWYRRFSFHPIDFLLGYPKYSEKPLYEEDVRVPLPEKVYRGHVKIYESTWKRPRWPFAKRMIRSTIEVPEGLPHAGKGENSWDCGDDAIFAQHSAAATPLEAVASIIESTMRNRERYGNASFLKEAR